MLNKAMIIGRLGRDPELRYTQQGQAIASLNVATDESYVDRDGNKVDRTEWHRVSIFGKTAENCHNFLAKGSLVFVEGSLTTRKWQDQQGQDRYTTEIKAMRVQFLDRKQDDGQAQPGQQSQRNAPQRQQSPRNDDQGPAFPSEASGIDEVPF